MPYMQKDLPPQKLCSAGDLFLFHPYFTFTFFTLLQAETPSAALYRSLK